MRLLLIAALWMATDCFAQDQPTQDQTTEVQQAAPAAATAPAPPDSQPQALTIPAGTRVPMTLTSPMRSNATRRGDAVRAAAAFPVTVGKQVAIPAGTYFEGLIDRVVKRGPSGHAQLQMHFTRIVFADGYNAALDGATAEARAETPTGNERNLSAAAVPEGQGAPGLILAQFPTTPPPTPTLPPQPHLGPSIGAVTGIAVGVAAAATVTAILLGRGHAGGILFDTGYQFEMVLGAPLALDADRVAAAVAGSNAQ
jgi:hypothetical protein